MADPLHREAPTPTRMTRALTDIHFWVPVVVLLAGLLLLRFIH